MAQSIPSVQQSPSVGLKSAIQFAIRGQRQADNQVYVAPSIGIYVAGVPQFVQGSAAAQFLHRHAGFCLP